MEEPWVMVCGYWKSLGVPARALVLLQLLCGCAQPDVEQVWGLHEKRALIRSASELPAQDARSGAFQVLVPVGVERGRVALAAWESLRIGDRATIREVTPKGEPQRYGIAVSLGSTSVGKGAQIGPLYAYGAQGLRLDADARVHGYVRTSVALNSSQAEQINLGQLVRPANPVAAFSWNVDLTGPLQGDRTSRKDAPMLSVPPGQYGKLLVEAGSIAVLFAGEYQLRALEVQPGGVLRLDNSRGAVYVWVRDELELSGRIHEYYVAPNILFGYAGESPPRIRGPFRGTLIAPAAEVRVPALDEPHKAAFYARSIVVDEAAEIDFRLYMGWPMPPDPLKICEECARRATKQARDCCDELRRRRVSTGPMLLSCLSACDAQQSSASEACRAECRALSAQDREEAKLRLDECTREVPMQYSRCQLRSSYRPDACQSLDLAVYSPVACVDSDAVGTDEP